MSEANRRLYDKLGMCLDCSGYGYRYTFTDPYKICKRCSGMGLVVKETPQKEEVAMPEIEQRRGKFWAVWDAENGYYDLVDSRFKPVDTEEDAHTAVEELAQRSGKRVYLLEAVWACKAATSVEWERL